MDTVLVLRSAIGQGRRYAFATAVGINTGAMTWGVAAAIGASALLAASELAYTALRIAGAAYVIWLGGTMLWRSFRAADPTTTAGAPDGVRVAVATGRLDGGLVLAWAKGLGTNLLNPKIGVFYIAMIPQFIPEGVSPWLMGVALAAVHNLLGLTWFALIIAGAHTVRGRLQRPRYVRFVDRLCGTALVGFGASLALKSR
ncbi:LysE family translocator [Zhihengliuella alba]|uniref:LysE family translocator n=1 Tax=Zhihengliuella alba TaxID=547018 RepID=A0ABP7DVN2_9MICC